MAFKPYQNARFKVKTSERFRQVQIISYPIVHLHNPTIMVRMVPGEPTTMQEVLVSDLAPANKLRYCHIAEVRTRFCFPEDMLRYDNAALYDHTISEEVISQQYQSEDNPILVYCLSNRNRSPWTVDRWSTFSATIKNVIVYDLNDHH